jgi:hypothetical protein
LFLFGRKRKSPQGDGHQVVSRQQFLSQVTAGTKARGDYTHASLMLRPGGVIGVQWEGPGPDRLERYRIVDPEQGSCPHCAVIAAIEILAELLDARRTSATLGSYELCLRMGRLPCPAFAVGSEPVEPRPAGVLGSRGWVADCRPADGDPHTAWDCADHALL